VSRFEFAELGAAQEDTVLNALLAAASTRADYQEVRKYIENSACRMSLMQFAEHNVSDLHGYQVRTPRLAPDHLPCSSTCPGPRSATYRLPRQPNLPLPNSSTCVADGTRSDPARLGHRANNSTADLQPLYSLIHIHLFEKRSLQVSSASRYHFTVFSVRRHLSLDIEEARSRVVLFLITTPPATPLTPVSELGKNKLCQVRFVAARSRFFEKPK
jgi:hypothetical protein